MSRPLIYALVLIGVVMFARSKSDRPEPPDPSVNEALVMSFEDMVPADRVKIRSRFASSRTFGRVSWRDGKLYCFLTRPGQEVERSYVEERLGDRWEIATFDYDRSIPVFGIRSGIKNRP